MRRGITIECRFCPRRRYIPDPPSIARCGCGARRIFDRETLTVRCMSQACVKVSPLLTSRYVRHAAQVERDRTDIDNHIATDHMADVIFERMGDIERECKYHTLTDDDWATHPLAVEYRALMRQWWTLPNAQVQNVLYKGQHNIKAHGAATDLLRDRERKIDKLVAQSTRNPKTGWYELAETQFSFYLVRDEPGEAPNVAPTLTPMSIMETT